MLLTRSKNPGKNPLCPGGALSWLPHWLMMLLVVMRHMRKLFLCRLKRSNWKLQLCHTCYVKKTGGNFNCYPINNVSHGCSRPISKSNARRAWIQGWKIVWFAKLLPFLVDLFLTSFLLAAKQREQRASKQRSRPSSTWSIFRPSCRARESLNHEREERKVKCKFSWWSRCIRLMGHNQKRALAAEANPQFHRYFKHVNLISAALAHRWFAATDWAELWKDTCSAIIIASCPYFGAFAKLPEHRNNAWGCQFLIYSRKFQA